MPFFGLHKFKSKIGYQMLGLIAVINQNNKILSFTSTTSFHTPEKSQAAEQVACTWQWQQWIPLDPCFPGSYFQVKPALHHWSCFYTTKPPLFLLFVAVLFHIHSFVKYLIFLAKLEWIRFFVPLETVLVQRPEKDNTRFFQTKTWFKKTKKNHQKNLK